MLREAPFSAALPETDRERLADVAVRRRFSKDAVLFSEGDPCDGFYLVASGVARIFKAAPDGRERVLHEVHAGDTFAEAALFGDRRFPVNVQALSELDTVFFPRGPVLGLLRREPEICFRLLASMSARLKHLARVIEDLSFNGAATRLAHRLLSEADTGGEVRLGVAKKDLAAGLGMTPETLSRLLKSLSAQGVLRVQGRLIRLLKPDELSAIASGQQIDAQDAT